MSFENFTQTRAGITLLNNIGRIADALDKATLPPLLPPFVDETVKYVRLFERLEISWEFLYDQKVVILTVHSLPDKRLLSTQHYDLAAGTHEKTMVPTP